MVCGWVGRVDGWVVCEVWARGEYRFWVRAGGWQEDKGGVRVGLRVRVVLPAWINALRKHAAPDLPLPHPHANTYMHNNGHKNSRLHNVRWDETTNTKPQKQKTTPKAPTKKPHPKAPRKCVEMKPWGRSHACIYSFRESRCRICSEHYSLFFDLVTPKNSPGRRLLHRPQALTLNPKF
jgi:hypothetical protein